MFMILENSYHSMCRFRSGYGPLNPYQGHYECYCCTVYIYLSAKKNAKGEKKENWIEELIDNSITYVYKI